MVAFIVHWNFLKLGAYMQILKGVCIILLLLTANAFAQTEPSSTVSPAKVQPLPGATPPVSVLPTNTTAPQNAPPQPVPTDSTITAGLQQKIASNDNLKNQSVIVATNNGVVTLTGTVENQDQVNLAVKLAKSVSGVKDVISTITIKK